MDKQELTDRLKKLTISNAKIERETGFPKNNLGRWLKSPELISDRWIEKLTTYLKEKEEPSPLPLWVKEIEDYCGLIGLENPYKLVQLYNAACSGMEHLNKQLEASLATIIKLQIENEELRQQIENAGRTLGPRKRTLKTDEERQQEAANGFKIDSDKPLMPKGLTLTQQIEWRANNP